MSFGSKGAVVTPDQAITAPASYRVIYAYSDTHPDHAGRLKVGDTTLKTSKSLDKISNADLEAAAKARIDEYTKTADIHYTLEHVELAVRPVYRKDDTGAWIQSTDKETFRDYKVHEVLMRDGYQKTFARSDKTNGEWFEVSVSTVRDAIKAVKEHEHYLTPSDKPKITLRPEQNAAVKQTMNCFRGATFDDPRRMLWNAKMRFGKTLTTYELIKTLSETDKMERVLILTHRPDVNASWYEDFKKMRLDQEGWFYGSKYNKNTLSEANGYEKSIWFASIQDVRGKDLNKSEFKASNQELFSTEWDLVVTDEAHEGTMTEISKEIFKVVSNKHYLDLSGTPFNIIGVEDSSDDEELIERFSYDDIFHWSYLDERKAKLEWIPDEDNTEVVNPYANLPEVKFVTYDISETLGTLSKETIENGYGGISFTELFRTELNSSNEPQFVHEDEVEDLLYKIQGARKYSSDPAMFPYHKSFENYFNHTLWMLPNVPACRAMEKLLKATAGFSGYEVINATGEGKDTWSKERTALGAVLEKTNKFPNTITLSQQMLSTGVTVTPWTAVFMLNNTSSPMKYMQAAFRAASPGRLPDGREKEYAYVFDFNPDRCLRQIGEAAKSTAIKSGDSYEEYMNEKKSIDEYLEYISVLSMNGSKFTEPDSYEIMEKLNEAYIDEVIEKGFVSTRLWNNRELQFYDINKIQLVETLQKIQGKTGTGKNEFRIKPPLNPEEQEKLNTLNQPGVALDDKAKTDKEQLEKKKEAQETKNRKNAVSILAGVAARLPMLVFAAPAEERITPENFATLIDDESWGLFMPKNLLRVMPEGTKSLEERQEEALGNEGNILYWNDIQRFFAPNIFILACERLRKLARDNAEKPPLEAAFRTAALFETFTRPDKETVLTPYRVVELQYTNTLGGLSFLDLESSTAESSMVRLKNSSTGELESQPIKLAVAMLDAETHELAPVWVDPVNIDLKNFWENQETTVLDVNSKTALYPLFAACSLFYQQCSANPSRFSERVQRSIWQDVVEKQVFANCRAPYAALIARRVLAGYNSSDPESTDYFHVNASVVDIIALKAAFDRDGSKKTGLSEEQKESLWRWIFDASDYGSVEDRVKEVLEASDSMSLKELAKKAEESSPKKFTAVVSNPPYQDDNDDAIYHHFVTVSVGITDFLSVIHPAKWITGDGKGEGLKSFKEKTLTRKTLTSITHYVDSTKIFPPPVKVRGGVMILFFNTLANNSTFTYSKDSKVREIHLDGNFLLTDEFDSIVNKIKSKSIEYRMQWSGRVWAKAIHRDVKTFISDSDGILIFSVPKAGAELQSARYKKDNRFTGDPKNWKVFVSQFSGDAIEPGYHTLGRMFIAPDNSLVAGNFRNVEGLTTQSEAEACFKYLQTHFVQRLFSLVTSTQNVAQDSFRLVPDQDFTSKSDIDWSVSVDEINSQLYQKYDLSQKEIALIERAWA